MFFPPSYQLTPWYTLTICYPVATVFQSRHDHIATQGPFVTCLRPSPQAIWVCGHNGAIDGISADFYPSQPFHKEIHNAKMFDGVAQQRSVEIQNTTSESTSQYPVL